MRWVFVVILGVHGVIHLTGFAKAFGLAELPQLTLPISRPLGVAWLLAAILVVASAIAFVAWPRGFWMLGLAALVVSQGVIVTSWLDARFGTIANVLLLLAVVIGAAMWGPTSARARLERESSEGLARVRAASAGAVVTEADLAALPAPVAGYLRAAGWLGRPRSAAYHLRFRGRIRGAADEPWMDFTAEQQSFADRPTRLFLMDASMYGLPVQSFHRFADGHASFEVRIAGLVPIVDARGAELDQAETVTLFNDMCLLAPTTLLSPEVTYEEIDAHDVLARFSHGGRTISARLTFGDDGLLRNFVSDDRLRSSRDGSRFTPERFSTPIHETRAFGPVRLMASARGRAGLRRVRAARDHLRALSSPCVATLARACASESTRSGARTSGHQPVSAGSDVKVGHAVTIARCASADMLRSSRAAALASWS